MPTFTLINFKKIIKMKKILLSICFGLTAFTSVNAQQKQPVMSAPMRMDNAVVDGPLNMGTQYTSDYAQLKIIHQHCGLVFGLTFFGISGLIVKLVMLLLLK